MAAIPLPPFAPDIASLDAAALLTATNVFPRSDGYGPVRGPVAISAPLPSACKGAIAIPSPTSGVTTTIAGTGNKLFRLRSDGTWEDVSGSETFGVPDGRFWSFSVYGDRLIATPSSGPTLSILYATDATFTKLGGSPPSARFNGVVGEYLVLAGAQSIPNALQWSDLGNIELWTPGYPGQLGDVQILPDGGAITGFAGGESGIVFQQSAIRRMVLGGTAVFDFAVIEQNRGCLSPSALVPVGGQVFFLDREGFFVLRDGAAAPIGAERVNRTFADRVEPTTIANTVAMRDPTGSRVIFAYRSKSAAALAASVLDEALVYDWLLDRWAFLKLPMQYGMPAASLGTSLDALTGNVDALTKSFDSPDYYGGVPSLGAFGTDNRLYLMVGAAMEAVIESSDVMPARPNRAFVRGFRADTDADGWRGQVGTRESLSLAEPVRWRPESGPVQDRFAPCRASGKYHRMRLRIPAGEAWSYATAIEPDAVADGMR